MKESENKKVSIKDVAKAVGVSTTLVSLVINGKAKQYRIADEMAGRVMANFREWLGWKLGGQLLERFMHGLNLYCFFR